MLPETAHAGRGSFIGGSRCAEPTLDVHGDEEGPGEVIVSSTVKDLVAGSGIRFVDRGAHILEGVPGAWRLFAVDG